MRTEAEMFQIFSDFAMGDERIRISVLEGSRTNANIPKDSYQDYDISFNAVKCSVTRPVKWLKSLAILTQTMMKI